MITDYTLDDILREAKQLQAKGGHVAVYQICETIRKLVYEIRRIRRVPEPLTQVEVDRMGPKALRKLWCVERGSGIERNSWSISQPRDGGRPDVSCSWYWFRTRKDACAWLGSTRKKR